MAKVKIRSDFPNQTEISLLKAICKTHRREFIYVKIFPRFGFSGAKLLLVFFYAEPKGLPYLVKIGSLADMKAEFEAIEKMKDLIPDCKLEESRLFEVDSFGALIYNHRGTIKHESAENPDTLRKLLYKSLDVENFNINLENILDEVYDKLENAHSDSTKQEINILANYHRYFRNHEATNCIKKILAESENLECFNFLGSEIFNPLKFIENLPTTAQINTGNVHGDLHPDNIVVDKRFKPSLIDFAWANEDQDILVDYVLLENSIRFMHFPKSINLEEQRIIDEYLLEENGTESINSFVFHNNETKLFYLRMANMIKKIRLSARRSLGINYSFNKYLFTQFIVLYGLLRFDTYNQIVGTRTLGLISKRLMNIGLDFLNT